MKKLIFKISFLTLLFIPLLGFSQNLPIISLEDNSFSLFINIMEETPLIFGYENPDINSAKMICFSSSSSDVENNPHKCALGAAYDTGGVEYEFIEKVGDFVKIKLYNEGDNEEVFYIEFKNVFFSEN